MVCAVVLPEKDPVTFGIGCLLWKESLGPESVFG
jgi:hypothetical protein